MKCQKADGKASAHTTGSTTVRNKPAAILIAEKTSRGQIFPARFFYSCVMMIEQQPFFPWLNLVLNPG